MADVILQTGLVTTSQGSETIWRSVAFEHAIVVIGPLINNGAAPTFASVRNITSDGLEWWPPYLGSILKVLFNLTGNEVDILRMVVEGARRSEISKRRILKLRDGRDLDYSVFGVPDGHTILFVHCEISGDTWFREAVELAAELDLKIIAPLRPGYGRSTLHSNSRLTFQLKRKKNSKASPATPN